ncbi:MAG: glycosyltransferase [Melioribacteraceae bacterium]|nr:glycosyltransferase [Melioribacteraceae bacterium]
MRKDQEQFNIYLSSEKLKDKTIYYPWKNIKYFPSYVSTSDVCISPLVKNKQHESGIANKVFQYMLFGKPLIVSNCKPQEILVKENNCGLAFRSEDAELSQKIIELLNDVDKRELMGNNGEKAVHEKYNLKVSWDKVNRFI